MSIPPRLVLLTQGVLRVGSVAVVGRGRSNSLAWWLAFTFLHTSFRLAPRLRSRLHALHRARQHQRGGRGGRGHAVSCIMYHVCWETRTHITRTQPNTKHRTQTNRHSASTKVQTNFEASQIHALRPLAPNPFPVPRACAGAASTFRTPHHSLTTTSLQHILTSASTPCAACGRNTPLCRVCAENPRTPRSCRPHALPTPPLTHTTLPTPGRCPWSHGPHGPTPPPRPRPELPPMFRSRLAASWRKMMMRSACLTQRLASRMMTWTTTT